MPAKKPFKIKGGKICISRVEVGRGRDSKAIQKCDKSGIVLRVGGVVYGAHGEVLHISRRPRKGEIDSMLHAEQLKKAGIQDLVSLKNCLGRADMLLPKKSRWSQKQGKEQLEKALQLFQTLKGNKKLGMVLKGVRLSPQMTPKEIKRAFELLDSRIVFEEPR